MMTRNDAIHRRSTGSRRGPSRTGMACATCSPRRPTSQPPARSCSARFRWTPPRRGCRERRGGRGRGEGLRALKARRRPRVGPRGLGSCSASGRPQASQTPPGRAAAPRARAAAGPPGGAAFARASAASPRRAARAAARGPRSLREARRALAALRRARTALPGHTGRSELRTNPHPHRPWLRTIAASPVCPEAAPACCRAAAQRAGGVRGRVRLVRGEGRGVST
jgi:hypothetical protein